MKSILSKRLLVRFLAIITGLAIVINGVSYVAYFGKLNNSVERLASGRSTQTIRPVRTVIVDQKPAVYSFFYTPTIEFRLYSGSMVALKEDLWRFFFVSITYDRSVDPHSQGYIQLAQDPRYRDSHDLHDFECCIHGMCVEARVVRREFMSTGTCDWSDLERHELMELVQREVIVRTRNLTDTLVNGMPVHKFESRLMPTEFLPFGDRMSSVALVVSTVHPLPVAALDRRKRLRHIAEWFHYYSNIGGIDEVIMYVRNEADIPIIRRLAKTFLKTSLKLVVWPAFHQSMVDKCGGYYDQYLMIDHAFIAHTQRHKYAFMANDLDEFLTMSSRNGSLTDYINSQYAYERSKAELPEKFFLHIPIMIMIASKQFSDSAACSDSGSRFKNLKYYDGSFLHKPLIDVDLTEYTDVHFADTLAVKTDSFRMNHLRNPTVGKVSGMTEYCDAEREWQRISPEFERLCPLIDEI